MLQPIGELTSRSQTPLLKMWSTSLPEITRPYMKHSHIQFEITVVNSGSGMYTTEHAIYPMLSGDIFVFSSNEIHCITEAGPDGLSITNLHFDPHYLSAENTISTNFCFTHAQEFQNRIPAEQAAVIRSLHHKILEEFEKHTDDLQAISIRSYLYLILSDLLRNQGYRSQAASINPTLMTRLMAVYDYIDQHLCEELTLDTLAAVAYWSPNYLSHMFKQLNGLSLWDYITAKRVEKAIQLILSSETDCTMLDIATQCGFNNTVNFNKAFKKHKGITPSEIKKHPEMLLQ